MECDISAFEGVLFDCSLISCSDSEMHVVVFFLAGYIGKKMKKSVAYGMCVAALASADMMACDIVFVIVVIDFQTLFMSFLVKWPISCLTTTAKN